VAVGSGLGRARQRAADGDEVVDQRPSVAPAAASFLARLAYGAVRERDPSDIGFDGSSHDQFSRKYKPTLTLAR